jgi:hypothetical protein
LIVIGFCEKVWQRTAKINGGKSLTQKPELARNLILNPRDEQGLNGLMDVL